MTEEEEVALQVRLGAKIAENNIIFWIVQLQHQHDSVKADMKHEDAYQLGYTHGLNWAIEYLKERLPDIKQHDEQMVQYLKELRNE